MTTQTPQPAEHAEHAPRTDCIRPGEHEVTPADRLHPVGRVTRTPDGWTGHIYTRTGYGWTIVDGGRHVLTPHTIPADFSPRRYLRDAAAALADAAADYYTRTRN